MTAQERELLLDFLQQLRQTRAGQKDPAAEDLIKEAVAAQPDAAYLLVQRAMGLDYALQAAKADLAAAQAELQGLRPAPGGGFIDQGASWGRSARAPAEAAPAAMVPAVSPGSFGRPAAAVATAPAPAAGSAWGGSMLGTVATTAAGVVAGSFLFQGIQGLMGQHGQREGVLGDHAKGGDAAIPAPAVPVQQAYSEAELDAAAVDEGYFDSGDGGGDTA